MDEFRKELEAYGWRTAPNGLKSRMNDAGWYAWRQTKNDARECEHNEGKRVQITLYPNSMLIHGSRHESVEIDLTGELAGVWYKLRAYSLSPAETLERMDEIEARLVRAWNALGAE